jgi:hypothetical protein
MGAMASLHVGMNKILEKEMKEIIAIAMAGPGVNPVQGFWTLPDLHWEFLRLWTGFELSSSCANLPCCAPNRNRNSFCVMR